MTAAKERPILFSAPMVRAILDGSKTQTRRAMKLQPADDIHPVSLPNRKYMGWESSLRHAHGTTTVHLCPYGVPGDRLWVRETWQQHLGNGGDSRFATYRATDPEGAGPWRPSIFMPRWVSRILLEITDVRVQRLQEISGSDALAEGIERPHSPDPTTVAELAVWRFRQLWESINGTGSWDANPWVWAIAFRRLQP